MSERTTVDMRPALEAEMAATYNELAGDALVALQDFDTNTGETASTPPRIQVLNAGSLLIEGAASGAANFLRGRGYSIVEAGDVLLAKIKPRGRAKPKPKAGLSSEAMTLRSAKAGGDMEVYTEATDVNTLKRLYQKACGQKAAVSFPMFCQQVDDIGSMHRQLYGEGAGTPSASDDEDEDGESTVQPPAPLGRGGPTIMASVEEPALAEDVETAAKAPTLAELRKLMQQVVTKQKSSVAELNSPNPQVVAMRTKAQGSLDMAEAVLAALQGDMSLLRAEM